MRVQTFCDKYVLTDRLLGSGTFGRVFMAIEQTTRTQLACKIVDLKKLGPTAVRDCGNEAQETAPLTGPQSQLKAVRAWAYKQKRQMPVEKKLELYFREFDILSSIRHPNIVAVDKVFVTDNTMYIFEDLIAAGDLFSYIESKNHNLSEAEAAVIIRQVVIAVEFLHDRGIVHQDLKAENVMLTSLATGARVVLTDFGSARKIQPLQLVRMPHTKGYPPAADMWSIGTISALLLVGLRPVDVDFGSHDPKLMLVGDLSVLEKSLRWRGIGQRPKEFVRCLLVLEEQDRLTAKQALDHPWFSNETHQIDFGDLYQRTIKHWRRRVPSIPLVEFVKGKCHEVKHFDCSRKVLEQNQPPRGRPRNMPVEPPYKPYYRRVADQVSSGDGRKRPFNMISTDMQEVNRKWHESMSRSPSPALELAAAQKPACNTFKKPAISPRTTKRRTNAQSSPSGRPVALTVTQTAFARPPLKRQHSFRDWTSKVSKAFETVKQQVMGRSSSVEVPIRTNVIATSDEERLQRENSDTPSKPIAPKPLASMPGWALNVRSRSKLKPRIRSRDRENEYAYKLEPGSILNRDAEAVPPEHEYGQRARGSVHEVVVGQSVVQPHSTSLRVSSLDD